MSLFRKRPLDKVESPEAREALKSFLIKEMQRRFKESKIPRFAETLRETLEANKIFQQKQKGQDMRSDEAEERYLHYFNFLNTTPELEELRKESSRLLEERTNAPPRLTKKEIQHMSREAELLELGRRARSANPDEEYPQ